MPAAGTNVHLQRAVSNLELASTQRRLEGYGLQRTASPLDKKGSFICLPKRFDITEAEKNSPHPLSPEIHPLTGKLKDFLPIQLKMVRGSPEEALHNSLISRYHYLGYGQIVGPHLKYLAYLEDRPIACLSWSSSLEGFLPRSVHRMVPPVRSKNLLFIVNNTRFLVSPCSTSPPSGLSSAQSDDQEAALRLVSLVSLSSGPFRNLCRPQTDSRAPPPIEPPTGWPSEQPKAEAKTNPEPSKGSSRKRLPLSAQKTVPGDLK